MAKNKKGGGLESLFFKSSESSDDNPKIQPVTVPATAGQEVKVSLPADVKSDAFVEKFREAIKKENEIGSKFIQLLYKLADEPKDNDYKKAFDMLNIMNPSPLMASDIASSMQRLIDMVKEQTSRYIQEGKTKEATLKSAFEEEKRALDETEATLKSEISALEESLRQKKAELSASERENQGLSGKYSPKIDEVRLILESVQSASEKTCSSLEQTLNDINSYLK